MSSASWSSVWKLPKEELANPLGIPFGAALRVIVLGAHSPDPDVSQLRESLAGYRHVEVMRCSWEVGAPLLEPF